MKTHEKLKMLLREKGRGAQTKLAEMLNEDKGFVSRWVSGKQEIPKSKLKAVANFLNVTVDYLLDETQEIPLNRYIPLIGEASCGVPMGAYYDSSEYIAVPPGVDPASSYAVKASGDSMWPTIADGEIVVCDTKKPPSDNSVVHYTFDGESGIKRVKRQSDGSVILLPDNTSCDGCDPIIIPKERVSELYTARCTRVFKTL
jgi:repressor LexA